MPCQCPWPLVNSSTNMMEILCRRLENVQSKTTYTAQAVKCVPTFAPNIGGTLPSKFLKHSNTAGNTLRYVLPQPPCRPTAGWCMAIQALPLTPVSHAADMGCAAGRAIYSAPPTHPWACTACVCAISGRCAAGQTGRSAPLARWV